MSLASHERMDAQSTALDAALRRGCAFLRSAKGEAEGRGLRVDHRGKISEVLQMLLPNILPVEAVQKTIWGSPAGKKRLAARLVKLIPAHKVYVEPFAGSAAVFFEKEPVDQEVLGDADPEIAFAFQAIKSLTADELAALRRKDWVGRERTFKALIDARPRSKVEKLYRFLYLSHFSYGKLRGKSFNPNADGVEARTIDRIDTFGKRLERVIVHHGHYAELVKKYDGKDTFFFLDPPYPGHNVQVGEDTFDEVEFRKVLDGIKGKFLVTYGTRGQLDTSGFQVRKIRPPRSIRAMRGVGGPKTLPQLLIANYTITEKSMDSWALDEIEGTIELSETAASDLDHACALVKALAMEEGDPGITALADQFERLEARGDERSRTLAHELLTIGDRLLPELQSTAPSLATALRATTPALEALAKGRKSRGTNIGEGLNRAISAALSKRIPLLKAGEERYVLGVVLEPETVDAQQDIYSAAEVREAAHRFMEEYQNVGLMHRDLVNGRVKILESFLAPADFEIEGASVKKGTWLLAVRVVDEELWGQIKGGDLNGFSIGGSAVRNPETDFRHETDGVGVGPSLRHPPTLANEVA